MEEQKEEFDPIEAEKKELDLILRRGVKFTTPKSKLFALISRKKEREFIIVAPPIGVLHMLSAEYIKMTIDAKEFDSDPWINEKKLPYEMGLIAARIVAIAVLGKLCYVPYVSYLFKCRNSLLIRLYTNYFFQKIDSQKLYQIVSIIIQQSHYRSFLNSITSLSLNIVRTTQPTPEVIEKPLNQSTGQ